MNEPGPRRATIYFETDLYRTIKVKAAEVNRTVSELVNEAVRVALAQDLSDLTAFEKSDGEATVSYEALLKELKKSGKL